MIGVDAGVVWVGDPCYILHKKKLPKTLGKNWSEFCDLLGNECPTRKQFNYAAGHEGLGVCVSSGLGDGFYPVYAEIEETGWGKRITKVWVDFMEERD